MKLARAILFLTIYFLTVQFCLAQSAEELQASARSYTQQGDYSNAILVLNNAQRIEPQNLDVAKSLAWNLYLNDDNTKALEIIKVALNRDDADYQCYQIGGNIYKQLQLPKECEKLYRKGLKKFPLSGAMHNLMGELLWEEQDYSAIKEWEKGIEIDPTYARSYYNACKYYYLTVDNIWTILYGEIFLNMEPVSTNAAEIKNILAEGYKKIFIDINKENKGKNKFETAFIETISKQTNIAVNGINPESLTMIKTRFILDWSRNYAHSFPFKLFDLQKKLLQQGMFDAYNEWIFGAAQNLAAYQNWTIIHATEYNEFSHFQKEEIFQQPSAEYYRY